MTQTGCSDKRDAVNGAPAPTDVSAATATRVSPASDVTDPFMPITQTASSGLSVRWIGYGATMISVEMPDGTPVLAGLDTPQDYAGNHPYLGSLIGRVANRIGSASFSIDGIRHAVTANENGNALHAGPDGFEKADWEVTREDDALVFRHTSPARHQGYPGNLDVTVRAQLSDRELQIKLIAITDAATPVNLTQHGYWNPAGFSGAGIDRLRLISPADRYTAVDETLLPTGESPSVEGTLYDFRNARRVGPAFIDANLLVPGQGLREMARLSDGARTITVLSDYPGLQIYSGEALDGNRSMAARAGLALEPQYPPDAVNQPVDGEDAILRPGEVYRHTIIYRFDGPGFEDDPQ